MGMIPDNHWVVAGPLQDWDIRTLEVPVKIELDSCINYSADIHSFH